ncbi:MAG: peptidoglycan DD-metalloendopeptidase family protein [Gammaproteobacteria bacterium]
MRLIKGKFNLIWLTLLLLLPLYTYASELDEKNAQLSHVLNQISELKQDILEAQQRSELFNKQLQDTEITIGKVSRELFELNGQLEQQYLELVELQKKTEQQKRILHHHRNLLTQQLQAAYQLGQHGYIKLLLNQQNPTDVSRIAAYYRRINQTRANIIAQNSTKLADYLANERKIQSDTEKLAQLRQQRKKYRQTLTQKQIERQNILVQLQQDITSNSQKLTELERNKKHLERIVKRLKRRSLYQRLTHQAFANQKGKLLWPTHGPIMEYFGKQIAHSELTNNGILIKAPEGQAVKAVYDGKVVFADWLRGFGLMLIIDHGQGFMSLYGQNRSLYKKTGDNVHTGELIASVGHSGGNSLSGLHFEIRRNGTPVSPEQWLRGERHIRKG